MKKLLLLLMAVILGLCVTACSDNTAQTSATPTSTVSVKTEAEAHQLVQTWLDNHPFDGEVTIGETLTAEDDSGYMFTLYQDEGEELAQIRVVKNGGTLLRRSNDKGEYISIDSWYKNLGSYQNNISANNQALAQTPAETATTVPTETSAPTESPTETAISTETPAEKTTATTSPSPTEAPTATTPAIIKTEGTVEFFDFSKENSKLDFGKILDKGYSYVSFNSTLFSKDFLEVSASGEYKYYGELKDNKPHGSGMVWHPSNGQFSYLTIGNYEKGYLNGYAVIYCVYQTFDENPSDGKSEAHHLMYKYFEGYFKNGFYDGKGNEINNPPIWDFADESLDFDIRLNRENYKSTVKGMAINPNSPFPFVTSVDYADGIGTVDYYFYDTSALFSKWDAYIGEFKDGEHNGKGKEYAVGELVFDGKYKDGNRQ